ncbi:LLM class flavin-dependent oxidoreductase [Baekduia soli]|uniref:LLM class flavin-dependent oxidoreductase n=1 Tax=Baekduia soli TaxID=496014 RepID=A0A5B8UC01_9ACTN|nr:LLM class flavin-dependent oxidoreductase [Baekduia soli]
MGEVAAAADAAGLDAAWAPELYNRSATITVAEMAHRTQRCRVGTAIAYGVGRSPLTMAAEARDLDEISDGRFVLGLGNGTRRMISDWHGLDPEAPAVRMEELVPLIRRLWRVHEEAIDHDGRFYRLHFRPTGDLLPPLRERIPIYTAGVNPRMIETAGRVADGLLGHVLFTIPYLEDVVLPAIEKGARRMERDPSEIQVASLVFAAVNDDAEQARRDVAAQIAFYASAKTYGTIMERIGFGGVGEAIREAFARRDHEAMIAAVPDAMIDALAVCGTAQDVRDGLRRYEGLLDHAILYTPSFGLAPERVQDNALGLIRACSAIARPR